MCQPKKIGYAECERWEKCLHIVLNDSFNSFYIFKMEAYKAGYEGSSKKSYF